MANSEAGPAFSNNERAKLPSIRRRPTADSPESGGTVRSGGDDSRSALAFRFAKSVKKDGGTYADFLAALEADPRAAE